MEIKLHFIQIWDMNGHDVDMKTDYANDLASNGHPPVSDRLETYVCHFGPHNFSLILPTKSYEHYVSK